MRRTQAIAPAPALALLLPLATAACERPAVEALHFAALLPRFEEGTRRFMSGDPALWMEAASRAEDAIVTGPWGASERGWPEVFRSTDTSESTN